LDELSLEEHDLALSCWGQPPAPSRTAAARRRIITPSHPTE
jgi:hypothetical protein